jgi:non-ribosomal peptide synthetase component F
VLGRWSGSDDVVVGTPVAGRAHPELERVVGCFVNTLPMRVPGRAGETVRARLQRAGELVAADLSHAELPFERIVDIVGPDRDLARTPLFQAMLTVHTEPAPTLLAPGLRLEWLDGATATAKTDVSLSVLDDGAGGTALDLSYRTDLFDPGTAGRLVDHVVEVLAAMADRLDDRLDDGTPRR